MDTSPEYIRQCEKAEEIQIQWKIKAGDVYVDTITFPNKRIIEIIGGHIPMWQFEDIDEGYGEHQRRSFWLPRQGQLQEMIETTETLPELIVQDKLAHFAMWVKYQCHTPFTSMEQLWLAFVMKEKYGKVWSGKDWQ